MKKNDVCAIFNLTTIGDLEWQLNGAMIAQDEKKVYWSIQHQISPKGRRMSCSYEAHVVVKMQKANGKEYFVSNYKGLIEEEIAKGSKLL